MNDWFGLSSIPAPSGHEHARLAEIQERLARIRNRSWRDGLGNLYVSVGDEHATSRVLIAAHADEVGLVVRYIDDSGFVFFRTIGGLRVDTLCGRRVRILSAGQTTYGVVAGPDPWGDRGDKPEPTAPTDESHYWIDVGANSHKAAAEFIGIGDAIVVEDPLLSLLDGTVAGRGLDNLAGVVVLARVLEGTVERRLPVSVTGVFTVQEEIGLRGARVANSGVDATAAVVVDVAEATDQPDSKPRRHGSLRLGGGPVVSRGPMFEHDVTRCLIQAAKRGSIPHQVSACSDLSSSDADSLQISRNGVPTALVNVPLRYMHSGSEIISERDVDAAVELLLRFLAGSSDG